MTELQYQEAIKQLFEQYYQKLSQMGEFALLLPEVDPEMVADHADLTQEWKPWKLVPSTVTEQDLQELEEEIETKLPLSMRAFLSVYHHYFESPIGRNPISEKFYEIKNVQNPVLIENGYLPFTWDADGYYIRCMKLDAMPDEEHCKIYQIDHEILFDFDEDDGDIKDELDKQMQFVAENLLDYLQQQMN